MTRRIFACVGIICVLAVASVCSFAQEQPDGQARRDDKTCVFMRLQGKVVDMDWVASTLVIKNIEGSDEVTFLVTRQTKITKGTSTLALFDLNIEDQVSVEYCDVHFTGLKALSIAVKE